MRRADVFELSTHERLVLGFHGCDATVARKLTSGTPFERSENPYDWLGPGAYFWEYGPARAWEWAAAQRQRRGRGHPAVVGAVIRLGRCFDLADTRYPEILAGAFPRYVARLAALGVAPPTNSGRDPDRARRSLDCAVLRWTLAELEHVGQRYDTVRGAFSEGPPVFPGAELRRLSHVQVAVRNLGCILGVFRLAPERSDVSRPPRKNQPPSEFPPYRTPAILGFGYDAETDRAVRAMFARVDRMTPEESLESFVRAGILTPDGRLLPPYRPDDPFPMTVGEVERETARMLGTKAKPVRRTGRKG